MTPAEHIERAHAVCRCGHLRLRHCGCGPDWHAGSPHDECCDEEDCVCPGFEPGDGLRASDAG